MRLLLFSVFIFLIFFLQKNVVYAGCSACWSIASSCYNFGSVGWCTSSGNSATYGSGCGINGIFYYNSCTCDSEQEARDRVCGGGPGENFCITNKGACAPKDPPYEVWRLVAKGWGQPSEPDACEKYGSGLGQGGVCGCNLRPNYSGRCTVDWTGGIDNCNNFHCGHEINDACSCGSTDTSGAGGGCPGVDQASCGSVLGGQCKWYVSVGNPGAECGPGATCNAQTGNCNLGNCKDICGQDFWGGCTIACKQKSCVVTLSTSPSGGYKSDVDQITVTVVSNAEVAGVPQLSRLFIQMKNTNVPPNISSLISSFTSNGINPSTGGNEYQISLSGCASVAGVGYQCTGILNATIPLPAADYYAYCDLPSQVLDAQPCTGSPYCSFNYQAATNVCSNWRSCDTKLNTEIQDDSKIFTVIASATPAQPECLLTPVPTSIPTSSPNSPLSASVTTIINSVEKDTYKVGLNRITFSPFGPTLNPGGITNSTVPNYINGITNPSSVTYVSGGGQIIVTGKLNTINLANIPASNYWTMDEDPTTIDNARILDYKANNTGKVVGSGVSVTSGVANSSKIGRARSFTGSGYLRLNQPITSQQVSGWFNSTFAKEATIYYTGDTNLTDFFEIYLTAGGQLVARNETPGELITLGSGLHNSGWHFFRLTYNTGCTFALEVDGILSGQGCLRGAPAAGVTTFGSRNGAANFIGSLDEIGNNITNYSTSSLLQAYDLATNNGSSLISCPVNVLVSSGAWWQVRGGSVFGNKIQNINIPSGKYLLEPLP